MKIPGVTLITLKPNHDIRGSYTEMYYDNWEGVPQHLPQWSVVHSKALSIRGMRVHPRHADYTCLVHGSALYVLKDLRAGSPTFGQVEYFELTGDQLQTLVTPPGVAHGFFFRQDSVFVVGITHYYDPSDELGFHFADPEAGIKWPKARYLLSDKDKNSPPMSQVLPLMPKYV